MQDFGRNYIESGEYIEKQFINKNVRYIAILDRVDNFEDRVSNDFLPIKGVFNELYCKETSKSVKNSKRRKMQEGFFACNTPPYGYKKDEENKGKLVVDEEAAKVVKKIFELKLDGYTQLQIADYLNKKDIPTPNQYLNIKGISTNVIKIWTRDKINRILSNQIYLGDCVRGKTQNISYKTKKRIYPKRKDFIVVKNTHEAIITREVYEAVHNKGSYGFTKKDSNKLETKFGDYIYCCYCGGKMEKRKSRKKIALHCRNNRLSHTLCDFSDNIFYESIEPLIINNIKKILKAYFNSNCDIEKNLIDKKNLLKANKLKEKVKVQDNKIRKIIFKISKLYNEKLNEKISEEEYKKEYKILSEKRKEYTEEKEMYEKEIETLDNKKDVKKIIEKVKSIIENFDKEDLSKNDVKEIISKIEIGKDKIKIHYNFENIGIRKISCLNCNAE